MPVQPPASQPAQQGFSQELRTAWRTWILGALLPVYLLTTFVGTLARVDGQSMQDTLQHGDLLVLLKYPRWMQAWGLPTPYPRRGDVLIFKGPADSPYSYETLWGVRHRPYNIKRVMALPGDTVAIEDNTLVVNGREAVDPYASEGFMNDQPSVKVPPGKVWVLGDNRQLGASLDSRAYGMVHLRDSAGPANLRLWPRPGLVGPDAPGN
ncbi:signal peptidase I [Deinococcus deserti]|uniref:Signal peptidase I n=1 Tax=Deinococcus deserti (strain DSM 17065 / CIP 109153 / LMG 22923 / VCD115) TaxID=546414 RepID=C1CW89_DEIDV|nr:signal peptidase I [Deinococcus deserti]ACO46456.1 putative Signal peptidase I (SPase I) (Leader peptidase I) (Peptidase S26A) [Deinococcus deserti VCD115]